MIKELFHFVEMSLPAESPAPAGETQLSSNQDSSVGGRESWSDQRFIATRGLELLGTRPFFLVHSVIPGGHKAFGGT